MRRKVSISILAIAVIISFLVVGGVMGRQKISSETFALAGTAPKYFMYKPFYVTRVYQYGEDGRIIEYKKGTDYEVDYIDGTIRRTGESKILDYSDHKVRFNDNGLFSFSENPRNPELNIGYQVLVDYITVISPLRIVERKDGLERTVEKLRNGQNIKILLCGDSIAQGAQTTGLYYFDDYKRTSFLGLSDMYIEEHYGVNCETILFGETGVSLTYMKDHLDDILDEKPDAVFIEFGMNDHVVENAEENIEDFGDSLSSCVEVLKEHGIDVILIGFFQQNEQWDQENKETTALYNHTIAEIAEEYKLPFVDVYSRWEQIRMKDKIEDMTSDYMHYPTDFGHRIYFSEIVPYFLDKDTRIVENYYLY